MIFKISRPVFILLLAIQQKQWLINFEYNTASEVNIVTLTM